MKKMVAKAHDQSPFPLLNIIDLEYVSPIFLYLFVSENTEMFFKLSFECSVVKLMLEHPNFYIKNNDSISLNNFKHNLLNTSCLLS